MAQVNLKRVLLGGVAGGVIWVIWSGFVNVVVLGKHYEAMMRGGTGLLAQPRYPFFLPVYFLSLVACACVLAWLYAGVRDTLGPGPGTALKVGALVGFVAAFPLNFSTATWEPIPRVFPLWWMIEIWLGAMLAALVAGWLYLE